MLKNYLLIFGCLLFSGSLLAQGKTGVNTTAPEATLHVKGDNSSAKTVKVTAQDGTTESVTVLNNGNVGINTPNPSTKLAVTGTIPGSAFSLKDGSQGDDKVLISDANGNAKWSNTAFDDRGIIYYNGPEPAKKRYSADVFGTGRQTYLFPASITLKKGVWMVYILTRVDAEGAVWPGTVQAAVRSGTAVVMNDSRNLFYTQPNNDRARTWNATTPILVSVTSETAVISPQWSVVPTFINGIVGNLDYIEMGLANSSPSNPCSIDNNYGCYPFYAVPIK